MLSKQVAEDKLGSVVGGHQGCDPVVISSVGKSSCEGDPYLGQRWCGLGFDVDLANHLIALVEVFPGGRKT